MSDSDSCLTQKWLQAATAETLDRTGLILRLISGLSTPGRHDVYREQRVGVHIRHILDHHEVLFSSLFTGQVDYGSRIRGGPEEEDCTAALERLNVLAKRVTNLPFEDRLLKLVRYPHSDSLQPVTLQTSFWREIDFVNSHATHHFAVIQCLCLSAGLRLPDELGLAPETRQYESRIAQEEGRSLSSAR